MTQWLISFPAFIKITLSFSGILLLYRIKIPLGITMAINSIFLLLWTGVGYKSIVKLFGRLLLPENVLLLLVIITLIFFTEALRKTGKMQNTIDALKGFFRKTTILYAGFPALIGLLPMPGGALFSAPFVKSVDKNNELDGPHKVAINYWFRHIWEYWWPLYPGVILAIKFSGIPSGIFFMLHLPFTVISLLAGYFFILKDVKSSLLVERSNEFDNKAVLATLVPIGMLVFSAVVGTRVFDYFKAPESLSNILAILAGLFLALTFVFWKNTGSIARTFEMFKNKSVWSIIAVVVGVQLFSSVLKTPVNTTGVTLVMMMRDEFLKLGIPIAIVIMIVPFISGMVTGVAMGFVGASFPLVFALLGENPGFNTVAATAALAYGFGYVGMLLSPVHICFVVTNEYFKTRLTKAYPWLIGPAISIVIISIILSSTYYFFL